MLFKHKHLLEDLRAHGRKARAEILSMTTVGAGSSARATRTPDDDLTTSWTDCRMKLRVVPEDRAEEPFEAEVLTRIHTLKFKGTHVPVWYDPRDRSRIVVDYELDAQTTMSALAAAVADDGTGERLAHRYDQRPALAWTPVGTQLLPLEVICRPGGGRLAARDPLGPAAGEAGRVALDAVRASAGSLLPALRADWLAEHDLFVLLGIGNLPADAAAAQWSATGVAIAAAIVSLLGGHLVRTDVAMTGALAPDGELLPVEGFAEKTDCAVKGFARRFVVPAGNERDARAISERRRKDLEFVYASTLDEALRAVLARHQVKEFAPPA